MEVIRVSSDDWHRLRDVRLRALADTPWAFASRVAEERSEPDSFWKERILTERSAWFVVVDGDRWCGLAGAFLDESPDVAWLISLWVEQDRRRHGMGRALTHAVVTWARQRGATEVRLWVTDTNEAAVSLYETIGFEPTEQRQPLPSDRRLSERMLRMRLGSIPSV